MTNYCCICDKKDRTKKFKIIDQYQLNRCDRCSLVFLEESKANLTEFIEDSKIQQVEFWSFPDYYKKYQEVFDGFFHQRLARLKQYDLPKGRFLDVGIGYGFWAKYLENAGYEVIGLDFSEEVVCYAKDQLGLEAQHLDFEHFETEEKFAAIFMFDVLEHFKNPDQMLQKARGLLMEGGVIYIQVPNVLGIKVPYGHSLGLPYHIWQFNPKSLKRLLGKTKLAHKVKYWTGIQGVIGVHERGGPSMLTSLIWRLANLLKIGNRVQIIGQKWEGPNP